MSIEFYKLLHIVGLVTVIIGLVGIMHAKLAGNNNSNIKQSFVFHGIGLALILISGFGMLAKLGIMSNLPSWALLKILIWLLLGAAVVIAKRKPQLDVKFKLALLVLVAIASYLALFKL